MVPKRTGRPAGAKTPSPAHGSAGRACTGSPREQIGTMSSDDRPGRSFTDEEVRAIFAAAADRQAEADHADASAPAAPDLEELKRIGAEAGIAPEHVEAAARALVVRKGAGVPSREDELGMVTVRRWLPGPVDDVAWERMVVVLRDTFDGAGSASRFGEALEWVGPEEKKIRARVEPGGDPGGYVLSFVFALMGGAAYGGTWAAAPLVVQHQERKLADVLDRLERLPR